MIIETKTQFADRQGVNKSTVTRWAAAGRLVLAPNGRVMVEQSIAKINASQGGRSDVADRHAQNRGQSIPSATNATPGATHSTVAIDDTDMQADAGDIGEDRAYYKAIALDRGNQQLKLDEALKNGKRLDGDDFKDVIELLGHQLRGSVERFIDNLAPQIAVLTDETERKEKIQSEIQSLLEQFN